MHSQKPVPISPQRDVCYSIGIRPTASLKERIPERHGPDSLAARAVPALEAFLSRPDVSQRRWYRIFYRKLLTGMSILYPYAHRAAQVKMAQEYVDDLIHGGYLRVLESLAVASGAEHASFAQAYARSHGAALSEVLIFGPRGGAVTELLHFVAAEKAHGMHRPGVYQRPSLSPQTQRAWYKAERTGPWPTLVDDDGREKAIDLPAEASYRSHQVLDKRQSLWRRNPALRDYTGAGRLGGETPYQILEDAVDVVIESGEAPLTEAQKARYHRIVAKANREGVDPFLAVYKVFPRRVLRRCWNLARRWLHEYSLALWEIQNRLWLAEGERTPAGGVVYRPKKAQARRRKAKAVPGTIYLNHGRYWWVVAGKMKPRPLIDPASKKKVPGTIFRANGRYYWVISGLLRRQRLVPEGQKFSTSDRATAERIAYDKWQRLRQEDPELASRILNRRQAQGLATKDRALAEKLAAKLWRQIQREDPELAETITRDHRPKAKDHFHAQLVVDGKPRHLGSYASRAEASAAYRRAFEETFGYPPGYNVQCIPKLEKVWPSWQEETVRLKRIVSVARMPVICRSEEAESLTPMLQRMQKVQWLVGHVIVVFDDNAPVAWPEVAIQSRGAAWYTHAKRQGRPLVIRGCVTVDSETRRIRITVYRDGYRQLQVLAEEIHHIGLKILFYRSRRLFAAIQRWYEDQRAQGQDPTLSLEDAFASAMGLEETGVRTNLPRRIVQSARKLLSPSAHVSACIMQRVITHWSKPLPV